MEEQQNKHPQNTPAEEQITEADLAQVSGGKDTIRRGLIAELESEDTNKSLDDFHAQRIEQTETPNTPK
ncbi:MAG: hypothetical protein AAFP20_24660 [Cyanobacteria bacterium J06614_10]